MFCNGRDAAEQWIKEGKNAVKWTKLSCRTFKDNQARLQLFALAVARDLFAAILDRIALLAIRKCQKKRQALDAGGAMLR